MQTVAIPQCYFGGGAIRLSSRRTNSARSVALTLDTAQNWNPPLDHKGAHFIGLVNVVDLKAGGLGSLGADQLKWLEDDVRNLKSSTPIIAFAHIPLQLRPGKNQ